jgi:hypothetical protein
MVIIGTYPPLYHPIGHANNLCYADPVALRPDFRGYRLTAMSTLPIGTDTLLYGSGCAHNHVNWLQLFWRVFLSRVSHYRYDSDAGKTVKADNVLLNEAMEKAGEHLNLASHLVPPLCIFRQLCIGTNVRRSGGRQDDHRTRRCALPLLSPLTDNQPASARLTTNALKQ